MQALHLLLRAANTLLRTLTSTKHLVARLRFRRETGLFLVEFLLFERFFWRRRRLVLTALDERRRRSRIGGFDALCARREPRGSGVLGDVVFNLCGSSIGEDMRRHSLELERFTRHQNTLSQRLHRIHGWLDRCAIRERGTQRLELGAFVFFIGTVTLSLFRELLLELVRQRIAFAFTIARFLVVIVVIVVAFVAGRILVLDASLRVLLHLSLEEQAGVFFDFRELLGFAHPQTTRETSHTRVLVTSIGGRGAGKLTNQTDSLPTFEL